MVTAFVEDSVPASSADSFSGGELASKPDARAGDPFLRRHDCSLGGVKRSDPLMILVVVIPKVLEAIKVMVVVRSSPGGLKFEDL
eukprot:9594291-Heterocapsa_arctica.AAC.1